MPRAITCSRCEHVLHVADDTTRPSLTCPRCLAMVVNPHALVRTPGHRATAGRDSLDEEVRRDSHGGAAVAVGLAVLVLAGVIAFLGSGGLNQVPLRSATPVVLTIGILVLGAIAAIMIAILSASKNRVVSAVTGVAGGLLIGAGIVVLMVILTCVGILQTCSSPGK